MKTRIITLLATTAAFLLGSALTLSAADKPAGACPMSGMSCPMSGTSGMSCPMSGKSGMSCPMSGGMSAMSGCCAGAMSAAATADIPANYPLKTCVVSGRELGKMGAPYAYTYKQAGQPDRTVLL